jgi:peroxiredoxin
MDNHRSEGAISLKVGDIAPDFVLPGSNDEEIHLKDLLDNSVVLVFFTDTFSLISIGLADTFLRLHESLSRLGVNFIGIATEPLSTLKTFIEEHRLPFTLTSDFDRRVSKAYGVYANSVGSLKYVARPSIIVVNTDCKIEYIWIGQDGIGLPNVDMIAEMIIKSKLD